MTKGPDGNDDQIVINALSFGGGLGTGNLSDAQFQTDAGDEAQNAQVRFLLDTSDTSLWFDENGSEAGGLTLVTELQAGADLRASDIFLI